MNDQEFLSAFTKVKKTSDDEWQTSKKKKQIKIRGNVIEEVVCVKCSNKVDLPDWKEERYGREYKPLCMQCKIPNVEIKQVNMWKAKCCKCKMEKDLFFVEVGESTFSIQCSSCCPKVQ